MTGSGILSLSAAQSFGFKTQLGGDVSLDLFFPLSETWGIAVSLGVLGFLPSDTNGGFLYRGYGAASLGVCVDARTAITAWNGLGALTGGGRFGVAGSLASYQYTTLFFFFPDIGLEGFLEFTPEILPFLDVRFSVPLRMQLRRDMTFSTLFGIGISVAYTFGRNI